MLARNEVFLNEVYSTLDTERTHAVACDVADAESVSSAFKAVKEHFGQLNGVVNNAGLARPDKIEDLKLDDILLQVNTGPVSPRAGIRANWWQVCRPGVRWERLWTLVWMLRTLPKQWSVVCHTLPVWRWTFWKSGPISLCPRGKSCQQDGIRQVGSGR